MQRKRINRILGCAVALGLALTMASCTDTTGTDPTPTATDLPTDAATDLPSPPTTDPNADTSLDVLGVTGGFGDAPEVTVPSPWSIDVTRTKVLAEGTGPVLSATALVQVNYYGVNGRTGERFDDSYSVGTPAVFSLQGVVPGFQKGLTGQKQGSRVLIAMPGPDGYDGDGGKEEAGIELGDTLIFVVDILRTSISPPTGETVTVTDADLPKVEGEVDSPKISIAKDRPAPTQLVVQPLVVGIGAEVEAGGYVQVNYAEYLWSSGAMIRQTYGFKPLVGTLDQTIPGWQEALVGQTIGSRVLVIVPPELAYPAGHPKLGIPEGSTMVFLIDVMFAWS